MTHPIRFYWIYFKKHIFVSFVIVVYIYATWFSTESSIVRKNLLSNYTFTYNANDTEKIPSKSELQIIWMKQRIQRLSRSSSKYDKFKLLANGTTKPNRNVHIFYYASFRNREYDGEWKNWNSDFTLDSVVDFPVHEYNPPTDIASVYYPQLGCYSSRNLSVISEHMRIIRNTSIGVVVVSWCPLDEKGFPKALFKSLLDSARKYDLQVAVHFQECGKSNNVLKFVSQIQRIIKNFGTHSALHKILHRGVYLPVFYIYDSDSNFPNQFKQIFHRHGNLSIRGTKFDGVFMGLLTNYEQLRAFKQNQFDGFYTYFGSNGLSYGSSWKNWQNLAKFARNNGLLFSPSVAPGYSDTSVKFWNSYQEKHRRNGRYYEVAWRAAITTNPHMISITSFNDWRGGTQIEPAVPQKSQHFTYRDYSPYDLYYYTNLTRYWITIFTNKLIKS